MSEYWTAADGAELDVLILELVRHYAEHRETCDACQPGDCPEYADWRRHRRDCKRCQDKAPLTHGGPCPRRAQFIAHGGGCPRCNPCPVLRRAVEIVVEWRDGRLLCSKAEWLRRYEEAAA